MKKTIAPSRTKEYRAAWYERNRDKYRARCVARAAAKKKAGDLEAYMPQADPNEERARLAGLDIAGLEPAMTFEEIGAALGISKARVGQILQTALRKLRRAHPEAAEVLTGEVAKR